MVFCVFLLISLPLFHAISTSDIIDTSLKGSNQLLPWYKQPQVYNMVAFSSEDIDSYHITVNGLWNGFIGDNLSSPFAFGRLFESVFSGEIYDSDKAFVDAQHAKGMKVPATILTIQGHRSFQEDDFEAFASRGANGELCPWDINADSYWMNILHPGFQEWCFQHGKKAIDAGADMIVLDEIQGNSFIPLYQWSAQYTGQAVPGFSNETIEGFRLYLHSMFSSQELSEQFGILDIHIIDLKERIKSTMNLTYNERVQADPLIYAYATFLEKTNFEAKKELIQDLRSYAASQGRSIVITANSFALGTGQHFGFWTKGLLFADEIDMFTFENDYTAVFDQPIPNLYRAKWLAWERLAYAATDAPAVTLINTNTFEAINNNFFPLFGYSNLLGILCAEAYANKGSFVNYHMPIFERERNWKQVQQIHSFVMNHTEFYDITSTPLAPVGVLFLNGEGMRTHMSTYLGCAQALAESHIPFEVIFDGDGYYIDAELQVQDLLSYPLIVVPSLLNITSSQIEAVQSYVEQGGIVLIFDNEVFNTSIGENTSAENGEYYCFSEDIGALYYATYDDSYRQNLTDIISSYTDEVLTLSIDERKVIVTPYVQKDNQRVILHMINYDHIGFFDFIWPHKNIQIELALPSFPVSSLNIYQIDGSITSLPFSIADHNIVFTIPFLQDYVVAVLE